MLVIDHGIFQSEENALENDLLGYIGKLVVPQGVSFSIDLNADRGITDVIGIDEVIKSLVSSFPCNIIVCLPAHPRP